MSSLRNKVIRLGYDKPELRNHLRPILDVLTKQDRVRRATLKAANVVEDNFEIIQHETEYPWIPRREFQQLEQDLQEIAKDGFKRFTKAEAKSIGQEMSARVHDLYEQYAPAAREFSEGEFLIMEDIGADKRLERHFDLQDLYEDSPGYFYSDLNAFVDLANQDILVFLVSVFEDLARKTERSDDPYAEDMAREYWEIAKHLQNRGI